jgi:methyl-accepting chemotaxis protein
MLNRYKIGTKLFAGFIIVLALLVAVGGTGWFAITQILTKMAEVEEANDLSVQGFAMQRKIEEVLVAMNKVALTKEEQYANEVRDIVADIQQTYAGLDKRMQSLESREAFTKTMDKVGELGNSGANYWKNVVEQKKLEQKRIAEAKATVTAVEKLAEQILQVTRENPKYAITRPGEAGAEQTFYDSVRVKLVDDIGSVSDYVWGVRVACYQYDGAVTKERKEETSGLIKQRYEELDKRLESIAPSIQTDQGRKLLDELKDNRRIWGITVYEVVSLTDTLVGIEAKSETIAGEMLDQIKIMLKKFDARAEKAVNEAKSTGSTMVVVLLVTCTIAVILGLILSYVLTVNITTGLKRAVSVMRVIADDGNVSLEIPADDKNRQDEVGSMARAVERILQQFQNVEHLATDLADGNYDVETKVRGDQDTMNINLNKMLAQVSQALSEIDESVKQVATGSGEVSSAAQALSNGAQESAASLEEITASMSEISSQTKANAESASQARDLAHQASKAATDGQTAMHDMTGAMERITHNSNEIQRVIKVIDDIAFQTNLLALNAAVEAAPAGQHGKGFAVVAEEVRNLASRSAKAAKETSDLIAKSGQEIEKGGEVATHTAEVLNTIVDQIKQTTDLVAGIAVASNEQAQGVNQITIGLQQIDAVTQQNTAAAEESASAASEMSAMATTLQRLVARFKLRSQSSKGTKDFASKPVPASTESKPVAPPKPASTAKSVPSLKPAATIKPVAASAPKPTPVASKPVSSDPSEAVAGDNWGGGGNAEVHIDLDDKNFGKY